MIDALSPLDGRYSAKLEEMSKQFSESALIRARVAVEIEWLIYLVNELEVEGSKPLSQKELTALRKLYMDFQTEFAEEVKEIEATTNHDVKAVEYFLRRALEAMKRVDLIPFIHFACTSEDINNLAHARMLKYGITKAILPHLESILEKLKDLAESNKNIPMMSRTHGQSASPTTVGKEFKNVGARLLRQVESLKKAEYFGKMNGATGNYNAHSIAYPEINWIKASQEFITSLGLSWQRYTTQIEPHDYMAEIFDNLRRINVILLDLDRDLWSYISYGYFKQRLVKGEVGSSTMPHKVNPIDFENSEGNLGLSNALLGHLSEKLPLSRMQRDLTDSTVLRNVGVALGYAALAYQSTLKGLNKLEVNEQALREDLEANWALLAEPIQTVMRRYGIQDAYEQLKALTRGSKITQEKIQDFVQGLDIPEEAKKRLLKLTPADYIGLANKL